MPDMPDMINSALGRWIRILGLVSLIMSLLMGCGGSDGGRELATSRASYIMLNIRPPEVGDQPRFTRLAPLATERQIPIIERLVVDVSAPDLPEPVVAVVTSFQAGIAVVELSVPQGTGRRIDVRAFNDANVIIYSGTTNVDLIETIHEVDLELEPILSLNLLIQADVNAAAGATLVANENAGELSGLIVTIPPGAFEQDTVFALGTRNHVGFLPPLPPSVMPVGPVIGFESEGVPLVEPASITIPYDTTNVGTRQLQLSDQALGDSVFRFFVLPPGGGMDWQEAGNAIIDFAAETITVPLTALGSGVIGRIMNTPPVPTAPPLVVLEDSVGVSQIQIQDPDIQQSHSFSITLAPVNGTAQVDATGQVTYTPMVDVIGTDTLTVLVTDTGEPPQSATVEIPITIVPTNDFPIAQNGTLTTMEDTPFNGNLNASDMDGDNLLFQIAQPASNGVVVLTDAATGAFIYTPHPNTSGADHFTFSAHDGVVNSNIATVDITITPVNDVPFANPDVAATNINVPVMVNILLNDSDIEGDPLSVTAVTQGANGVVTISGASVIYTPNSGFEGMDTFMYTVGDGQGGSAMADVTISVTTSNTLPNAVNDSATTAEDNAAVLMVLANDTDPDGDALIVNTVTQGNNGTVTHNGLSATYTPNADYSGTDTFTYNVCDNGVPVLCHTAAVMVTVTAVNDVPIANNGTLNTIEDTPINGMLIATDIDGDTLTFSIVAQGSQGIVNITNPNTGTFTYTPNPNANGPEMFTFRVNDGTIDSNIATINVNVAPVNDPPMADDSLFNTNEDTPHMGFLTATDAEGDGLTFSIVAQGAQGSVTIDNPDTGAFTYIPNTNANGPDVFTFHVNDGTINSNIATVNVAINPINDPPVAMDGSLVTTEDINSSSVLPATDVDGDPLTFAIVMQGNQGSATIDNVNTGAFTYTPNPDMNGPDTLTFSASDGTVTSNVAVINVNIMPVDDLPIAMDDSGTTNEDMIVNIAVLPNDIEVDGEPLSITGVTQGSQGSVTHDGTTITYTPDPDTNGMDMFTYTISDTPGGTDTANVSVTITPVNDPPIALNRALISVTDWPPTPGTLLGIDVDGDPLTFIIDTPPSRSAIVNLVDPLKGTYTYTDGMPFPPPNSFTYKVNDGTVDSNIATVMTDQPLMPFDLIYAAQAGSMQNDEATAITASLDGSVAVTGSFEGIMTLGKGSANETLLMSNGKRDIFVAKYFADGTLAWAKRAGGAEDDEALGIVMLAGDAVAITGQFQLTATFGAGEPNETMLASAGLNDIFVARYDPNGMLVWAKQAGGSGDDTSEDLTVLPDVPDEVVITGSFHNTVTFDAGMATETMLTSSGLGDIFIAKYNNMGNLDWARRAGGSGDDEGLAIEALPGSMSVITGGFENTATFGASEPGETMLTSNGMEDVFVAQYDPNGMLVWAVQGGGSGEDVGTDVTRLALDDVVVTGTFQNNATFVDSESTSVNLLSAGAGDIFLIQYDVDALIGWAVRAGGSGDDESEGITSLPDLSLVVTGAFENTATFGPLEPNETMLASNGMEDIFIAHYAPNGLLLGAKGMGGVGSDEALGIYPLFNGHSVITGHFEGMVTFGPGEPLQTLLSSGGMTDAFIARFFWFGGM